MQTTSHSGPVPPTGPRASRARDSLRDSSDTGTTSRPSNSSNARQNAPPSRLADRLSSATDEAHVSKDEPKRISPAGAYPTATNGPSMTLNADTTKTAPPSASDTKPSSRSPVPRADSLGPTNVKKRAASHVSAAHEATAGAKMFAAANAAASSSKGGSAASGSGTKRVKIDRNRRSGPKID